MKILFVCRANAGRSQMAEAFFNKLSKETKSISAGTQAPVEMTGLSLANIGRKNKDVRNVINVVTEYGYDISSQKVKQLNKGTVKEADKIIVMCSRKTWPDFLETSSKVEYWNIEDPYSKSLERFREIRDEIKAKVKNLIKEIEF